MPLSLWFNHFSDSKAEIHQIFALFLWEIEDTKKSFRDQLTFSRHLPPQIDFGKAYLKKKDLFVFVPLRFSDHPSALPFHFALSL